MSVLDVVLPRKILVQGASLPRTVRPKYRGWSLSSTVSVMGCQAFPATPTSPSSDISGAGSCPEIAQPLIFAPNLEKASSTADYNLWADLMSFRLSVRNVASSGS